MTKNTTQKIIMNKNEHFYAVIMAGGGGTRLWPVSRRDRPKQSIPLISKESLFQTTVRRLDGLIPTERIFVVTVDEQAAELRQQAPELPFENFLLEPAPRGTASVVGLAAAILHQRDPQAVMAILPSDHYIRDRDLFHYILRVAADVAQKDYLVTLGIAPTFAATGYGYIQRGAPLAENFNYPVYTVSRFKEKPDEAAARTMLYSGDHSWNSGMFIWKTERILNEFTAQMPALQTALNQIVADWDTPARAETLNTHWMGLKNETIDYGIMEHAERVAVIPAAGLEWSDIGSWDALFDVILSDKDGNVIVSGELLSLDTHGSLLYGNDDGRLFVTIGLDNIILVDTGDVLLACHRDRAQEVRLVVEKLKSEGREKYT
jgi:mannose-1-phosphate guanylyltransferase